MKKISFAGIKRLSLAVIALLILVPVTLTLILKNYILGIVSIGYIIIGFTALMVMYNKAGFLPVPLKFKKLMLMGIILRIELVLGKIFKLDTENIMQYFIFLNNRLNPQISGKKILLLLPRCIQDSSCSRDLTLDINNCLMCGKCQVAEIIKLAKPRKVEIRLVGGGTLALERIREIKPEGVIAVACERDLIKGIKETFNIPVWAIANLRPNGPCLNTKIQLDELEKVLAEDS